MKSGLILTCLTLVTACGPISSSEEGECRAWCEETALRTGMQSMTELCADVPETVAGCDDCLQLWDEMMVTEAQVKVTCACVNGTETLEPWQACQADEESWEAEFAGHEQDCAAEAASFGYTACLD